MSLQCDNLSGELQDQWSSSPLYSQFLKEILLCTVLYMYFLQRITFDLFNTAPLKRIMIKKISGLMGRPKKYQYSSSLLKIFIKSENNAYMLNPISFISVSPKISEEPNNKQFF